MKRSMKISKITMAENINLLDQTFPPATEILSAFDQYGPINSTYPPPGTNVTHRNPIPCVGIGKTGTCPQSRSDDRRGADASKILSTNGDI